MSNIIMVTHLTYGDVLPFMTLSCQLQEKGHKVTLITHKEFEEEALNLGIDFEAIDEVDCHKRMMKEMEGIGNPLIDPEAFDNFNKKYFGVDSILREVKIIQKYCKNEDTIIICRHRTSTAAYLVAELRKIPIIPVFLAPTYVNHLEVQDQLIGHRLIGDINEARRTLSLPKINCWLTFVTGAKHVIGLWPEWFGDQVIHNQLNVNPVGFVNNVIGTHKLDASLETMMESNEKPILVTGGTSMLLSTDFYNAAGEALEAMNCPTILACKHQELLPNHLGNNIKVYSYIPFHQIIKDVRCIIHHGGIGTIALASRHGVPQLILPSETDRPDNAKRVESLGIGKYIPIKRWDSEIIRTNIEALTSCEVQERCNEIANWIDNHSTIDNVIEVIQIGLVNSDYLIQYNDVEKKIIDKKKKKKVINDAARSALLYSMSKRRKGKTVE